MVQELNIFWVGNFLMQSLTIPCNFCTLYGQIKDIIFLWNTQQLGKHTNGDAQTHTLLTHTLAAYFSKNYMYEIQVSLLQSMWN